MMTKMCLQRFFRNILIVVPLWMRLGAAAQPHTDAFLKKLFRNEKDSLLQHVLANPEIYRYQLVYTQIDRDAKNNPSFTNYYYQSDSLNYFNPAAAVKLPLALLTL